MYRIPYVLTLVTIMTLPNPLPADEGLWLFNHPPKKHLKDKYGFDAPQTRRYDHLQKSSVRFNSGGSGSFISPDGLVMTNHHVGLGALQKLSSKGPGRYIKKAKTSTAESLAEQEYRSVDEELVVLEVSAWTRVDGDKATNQQRYMR